MKKILYLIFAVAAFAAVSCTNVLDMPNDSDSSVKALTIQFSCGDMVTRAVNGENNENLVKRIDYFFFPLNGEGEVDDDTEYVYRDSLIVTAVAADGKYSTTVETGVLNQIFPDGNTKAMIFAVANYVDFYGSNPSLDSPNTRLPKEVMTWKTLHEMEVGATFFEDGGEGFELRWPRKMYPNNENLFFVMTGEKDVELATTAGEYAIQAEVPLKRLASKVTIAFECQTFIEEKKDDNDVVYETIKWEPQSNGDKARVFLSNAIEHTTLGGPLSRPLKGDSWANCTKPQEHNGTLGNGTRDIFEYAYDYMKDITETDSQGRKLAHYYTYPISMEEGDNNQPYLKLVLPWQGYKNVGTDDAPVWKEYKQKEVYYKIVLPRQTICDPNMIYQFFVNVTINGSDKDVQVIGEQYVIKDWSTEGEVSSNLAQGRYISLDIPKDTYDMYGDDLEILFVSSGEVEISELQISTINYSNNNPATDWYCNDTDGLPITYSKSTSTTDAGNPATTLPNWVTIQGTHLVIKHAMNNNINSSSVNIAPFTFVIKLHLKGETSKQFDRTVTITQYPSIYIEARPSNGYVYVNGYYNRSNTNASTDNTRYWAFDDSKPNTVYTNQGQADFVLGSVTGVGQNLGNSNNNTNMYAVNVSILKVGDLVVGDPRGEVKTLTNLALNGNYRPADSSEEARNIVSPYFLTSSAYSKTILWIRDFERAEKRCAAFQEAGYPAGRWRLPTEGEISFMVNLSNNNLIPSLFMGCPYWASSGRLYNPNTKQFITAQEGANIGDNGVRCIYDLWYWGNDPDQTLITNWNGYHD